MSASKQKEPNSLPRSRTDLASLRERFSALSAIEQRAVARTADEILPLLAPFLFHQTEGLSKDLLLELLAEVRPHVEALVADLEEAAALGQEIESATRRLAPQSAQSGPSRPGFRTSRLKSLSCAPAEA